MPIFTSEQEKSLFFVLFCFSDDKRISDTYETVVVLQNKTKITVATIQIWTLALGAGFYIVG